MSAQGAGAPSGTYPKLARSGTPPGYVHYLTMRGADVVALAPLARAVREALAFGTLYEFAERQHAALAHGARRLQGRAPVYAVTLPDGATRVVVRHSRHGGLLAPTITDGVVADLPRPAKGTIPGHCALARVTTSATEGVGSDFPAFFPDGKVFYIANSTPKNGDGAKRFTSPHSSACRAGIGRLSISISRARLSPMWSGNHWVAPPQATLPTCVPTCRSTACSAITERSQASWDSLPPPTAMPLMRAMVGFPEWRIASR